MTSRTKVAPSQEDPPADQRAAEPALGFLFLRLVGDGSILVRRVPGWFLGGSCLGHDWFLVGVRGAADWNHLVAVVTPSSCQNRGPAEATTFIPVNLHRAAASSGSGPRLHFGPAHRSAGRHVLRPSLTCCGGMEPLLRSPVELFLLRFCWMS